jgi:hypothetical protein
MRSVFLVASTIQGAATTTMAVAAAAAAAVIMMMLLISEQCAIHDANHTFACLQNM